MEHLFAALGARQRQEQQRQLDVLIGRQHWQQVIELKDEADVAGAPPGQLRFAHTADEIAADLNAAMRRRIEAGDEVEERGFAGAARPHQREKLAFWHFQRQIDQYVDLFAAALEGFM